MDTNDISACEKLVMKVIWDSTEELALQEVMDGVNHENGKNWKPQTVSTFLSRLGKERLSEYVPQGQIPLLSAACQQGRLLARDDGRECKVLYEGRSRRTGMLSV